MHKKQVEKNHYNFQSYMAKERWVSVWHQIDEVYRLKPKDILEIGPGPGLFKGIASLFEMKVETLDIDPDLHPDHVGSVMTLPFTNESYDVVCAFQMLEHIPYDASLDAFDEIVRVSSQNVIISLPDAQKVWPCLFPIPGFGSRRYLFPKPRFRAPVHVYDGQHYWEINKRDYPLSRIVADLSVRVPLIKTFRVFEFPYHRFFVFQK